MAKRKRTEPSKHKGSCLGLVVIAACAVIAVQQCGRIGSNYRPIGPRPESTAPTTTPTADVPSNGQPGETPAVVSKSPPLANAAADRDRPPAKVDDATLAAIEKNIQALKDSKILERLDLSMGRISVTRRNWGAEPYEQRRAMAELLSLYRKLQRKRDKIELWDDTRYELVAKYSDEVGYWEKDQPTPAGVGGGSFTPGTDTDPERGCSGEDPCHVCKTCSSCRHCSQRGGTCGACR